MTSEKSRQKVLEVLADLSNHPDGAYFWAICANSGLSTQTVGDVMRELIEAGEIEQTGNGDWQLVEQPIKIECESFFDRGQWDNSDIDTFQDLVSTDAADFIKCFDRLKKGEEVPSISGTFIFRMKQNERD